MRKPADDPSVFSEPHMRPELPAAPAPNDPASRVVPYATPDTPRPSDHDLQQDIRNEPMFAGPIAPADVDATVWDEPHLSRELAGQTPQGQPTYATWLAQRQSEWTAAQSWLATIGLALLAGPLAIVGAFWGGGQSIFSVLMLLVIGPVTEEIMKVAAPTIIVEKWPYVFRGRSQILLCALCAGLAFAAIENVLYLFVYVRDPSQRLVLWRWTVCVALHSVCSLIAGIGVMRSWQVVMTTRQRANLLPAFRPLVVASVVHGAYNAAALVMEANHLF
jgi:hypothetical protein